MARPSDGVCCPYCGGESGFMENARAHGWVRRYATWDGEVDDTSFEQLRERVPHTVKCVDCDRVVENPLDTNGRAYVTTRGGRRDA